MSITGNGESIGSFEIPPTQHTDDQISVDAPQTQKPRRTSVHVRNLSPVDIVVSSSQEVNEEFSQPPVPNGRVLVQPVPGAKRSLVFGKPIGKENLTSFSSTPMIGRKSTNTRFFNKSISAPSPIKAADSQEESSFVLDESVHKKTPRKSQQVSMADIEQNLRSQYNIPNGTETAGPARRKSTSVTTTTPKSSKSTPALREASVVLEPMSMEVIKNYRKQQMSRLSLRQNVTDVEEVSMQETRIRPSTSHNQFAELKKKLDLCDLTDDESEKSAPVKSQESRVETNKSQIIDEIERSMQALFSGDESENEEYPVVTLEEMITPQEQVQTPRSSTVNNPKESTPEPASVSMNGSVHKHLPQNFIESFQNHRKTNNLTKTSEFVVSIVNNDTVKRQSDRTSMIAKSYLAITGKKQQGKNKKRKRNASKKRTLYNRDEEEDETTGDSNSSGEAVQNNQEEIPPDGRVQVHSVEVIIPAQNEENTSSEVDIEIKRVPRQTRSKRKREDESTEQPQEKEFEFKKPMEIPKVANKKVTVPSKTRARSKRAEMPEEDEEQSQSAQSAHVETEIQAEEVSTTSTRSSKRTKRAEKPDEPAEPRKKKFRRIKQHQPDSSDEDEPEKEDEGIGTDDDVIYEPHNDRYGLRVRKAYKPYWLFNEADIRSHQVAFDYKNVIPTNKAPQSCINEFKLKRIKSEAQENESKSEFKKPIKPAPKVKARKVLKAKKPETEQIEESQHDAPMQQPDSSVAYSTTSSTATSLSTKFDQVIHRLRSENANSTCNTTGESVHKEISENGRRKLDHI